MAEKNLSNEVEKIISSSKTVLSKEGREFEKYCKLFEQKFKRHAYIAEPSGTKEQTVKAIKICLAKNKDVLDQLLYGEKLEEKNRVY